MTKPKAANWIAFTGLIIATIFGHYWFWGVFFILWSIQSFITGSAFLLTPIPRHDNPILFPAVCLMWLFFGLWEFAYDFLWRIEVYTIFGHNLYGAT